MVAFRAGQREEWELGFNGDGGPVSDDERVLEMDGDDGCTIK